MNKLLFLLAACFGMAAELHIAHLEGGQMYSPGVERYFLIQGEPERIYQVWVNDRSQHLCEIPVDERDKKGRAGKPGCDWHWAPGYPLFQDRNGPYLTNEDKIDVEWSK